MQACNDKKHPASRDAGCVVLISAVNKADYDLYHRVHLVRMALGYHQRQRYEGEEIGSLPKIKDFIKEL